MPRKMPVLLALFALLISAAACQSGAGDAPLIIRVNNPDELELAWFQVWALENGHPFQLEIPEEVWDSATQEALADTNSSLSAIDVTFQPDGLIRYDFTTLLVELNREVQGEITFDVALTTDGDFVISVESATLSGERGSITAPPLLLSTLNGTLAEELSGQQYNTTGGQEIHFTGVEVSSGLLTLEGYLEAPQ